jgi:hypothetical protein
LKVRDYHTNAGFKSSAEKSSGTESPEPTRAAEQPVANPRPSISGQSTSQDAEKSS